MSKLVGKPAQAGKLRKPEPDKKKIAIIIAVIAVVCISAFGGLYYAFRDKGSADDEFGPRRRWRPDANMPNPDKQNVQDILAYKDSDAFRQLSQREQFIYTMASGRKLREYEMQMYFSLPKEQQTAYLDKMIDDMQAQRAGFEQMRQNRPPRPPDANDPNAQARRQARMAERAAQRANPANARARSERGTALQRAQREQFRAAMQKRMQQRGITPPARGGGGRGGGPGGP